MNGLRAAVAIPSNVHGLLLMVGSTMFASGMHAAVKLVADGMHPLEIYFLRQLAGVLMMVPWFVGTGFLALQTTRPVLQVVRGAFNATSGMMWFMALAITPLAKATALNMSGALFAVLGAILFLGEKLDWRRMGALTLGFAGVVVIAQPGGEVIGLGVLLVLGSRVFNAVSKLLAKVLSRTERTPTIVAYTAMTMTTLSCLPALYVWRTPMLDELGWIVVMAVSGTLGQLCMVQAYKVGDIGAVEPASFSRLIWAALFGYLFFAEVPEIWVWVGSAMIIAAVTVIARSESRGKRTAGGGSPLD